MPTLSPEFVSARAAFAAWYDSKDAATQELIDSISDRTYFIIEEQDYDRFINMLDEDYGITSAMDFEDRFEAEIEGYGDRFVAESLQDSQGAAAYFAVGQFFSGAVGAAGIARNMMVSFDG